MKRLRSYLWDSHPPSLDLDLYYNVQEVCSDVYRLFMNRGNKLVGQNMVPSFFHLNPSLHPVQRFTCSLLQPRSSMLPNQSSCLQDLVWLSKLVRNVKNRVRAPNCNAESINPCGMLWRLSRAWENVLSPPPVFWLGGKLFFVYSALAFSIKSCLCLYSLSTAASLAAAERDAWW